MDTEYEYRLDPADPTRILVRRKPRCGTRSDWTLYNVPCDTEAQARRVLALLEGSGEAQVYP